jgi:hypothetical protein
MSMLVISSAVVLADVADGLSLNHPLIGWHNVVTSLTIDATSEEANYPPSNLANPATHLEWRATSTSEQYLTISTNYLDEIDYVGIVGHNFWSAEIPVSIGYFDTSSPPVWVDLVEDVMLPDDGPAIFRFTAQPLATVEVRLGAGSDEARAAVVYVGKLLVIERKIYVGHTPMPDGIKSSVVNGRSESGKFLGRIQTGEWRESTIPMSLVSPDWFRTFMRPFLRDGKNLPFFFAWRPEDYPFEVGYGWMTDDPVPAPVGPSNLIAFDIKVSGVV